MMDRDEIMKLSDEKAAKELSRESIEFLFRPSTVLELLLRCDFDGMKRKIDEWFFDVSPDAMPHRFRSQFLPEFEKAIAIEEFYQEITEVWSR